MRKIKYRHDCAERASDQKLESAVIFVTGFSASSENMPALETKLEEILDY